ncbi:DNA topoisomerase 3 [Nannocystis radixulma]|uniref:ATP-dependent DNA helicase RecQ n=1 Tax=Nannocystis radixulma TaxID=2995305 RepID=A0ABT5BP13_9BACT|nr:DNA topoisomerase 3 [Nannocystis radixulma]MDC0675916.1 DNA topoisomerase 3 [Nannocystis radixulma]
MTTAVLAEKPSVARDIAAALGATRRRDGCFEGDGYIVTWAIGHLVALAQPHEIDPAWKRWSLHTLPMLPTRFPLVVVADTGDQFAVVRRILRDPSVTGVICATDAGREGELIFRYIYEASGCKKPVRRLWISSLTPAAIRDGFARLRSSAEFDGLADAARGRSRADWLVGMNLSRAYSLVLDEDISVGRVQTPTLAILVERELAIREFVPEDYREVVARFQPITEAPAPASSYVGTWFRPPAPGEDSGDANKRKRLPADGAEAAAIVARALAGRAQIASIKAETRSIPPPLLYDLTELQRHANRLYGMSAQRTLDVLQGLYERHKLVSYPRTDSRHLSTPVAATLGAVVAAVADRYPGLLAPGTGTTPLRRRFVDDARVTDHHAILPTATPARAGSLTAEEQKLYDLICRRLLEAWHDDYVYSATTVVTTITSADSPAIVDHYESRGTAVQQPGWKVLEVGHGKPAKPRGKPESGESDADEQALPPGLVRGQPQQVLEAKAVAKQTRPPPRHTEASLLTAMETAGKTLEEKELSEAMRDLGLGTPATRAQIIETLLRREYAVRDGKSLAATDKGIHLISVVHPEVRSPAMTGEWEAKLKRMSRGDGDLSTFMAEIASFVTDVVGRVTTEPLPLRNPSGRAAAPRRGGIAGDERGTARAPEAANSSRSRRATKAENEQDPVVTPRRTRKSSNEPALNSDASTPHHELTSERIGTPPTTAPRSARKAKSEPDGVITTPAARRTRKAAVEPDLATDTSAPISPPTTAPRGAPRTQSEQDGAITTPAPRRTRKAASEPDFPLDASPSRKLITPPTTTPRGARRAQDEQDLAITIPAPDLAPDTSPPHHGLTTAPRGARKTKSEQDLAITTPAPRRTRKAANESALAADASKPNDSLPPPDTTASRSARNTADDAAHAPATTASRNTGQATSSSRAREPAILDLLARSTNTSERPLAPTMSSPRAREPVTLDLFARSPSTTPSERAVAPTTVPRPREAPIRDLSPRSEPAPSDLRALLQSRFGFPGFRPYQEAVCRAATRGRDLLLVMPTGAGKSLCYQLPGIARGGTTLVISPLIALMEDQSTRLAAQGFRAERIHSGRSRVESRQACVAYLAGELDFLFIAPERLRVPGFPEMLARRTPALIAVDEAHCISQWGHDFRPDYRMLGQRLPALRPAPIIALTATATPTVQDDIVEQLGLRDAARFIHGFRRTNIAIEVLERNPGERAATIRELLSERARRPAIVYAATRKNAEELADALGPRLAAAYHAGMSNDERDRVQTAFLAGQREVIVATTAFGMGIDKADVRTIIHAALPGSLEGYYQEIGRAGRDGRPATAILMHAYVDRKTHEFFHERDYPEPKALAAIYTRLPKTPTPRATLNKKRSRAGREAFERALEKLIVHGGAIESGDGEIAKGAAGWSAGYEAQRAHKEAQLQLMARFAGAHGCRMVHLIRHFGDREDGGEACGLCDVCAPDRCIAQEFRAPSASEKVHVARLLAALAAADGQATGRLHRDTFPGGDVDRRSFEHLLGGLVAAGLVTIEEASFTKRGKVIPFERATLTAAGRSHESTAVGLKLPKPPPAKKSGRAATSKRTRTKRRPAAKRTSTRRTTTKRKRAPSGDDD